MGISGFARARIALARESILLKFIAVGLVDVNVENKILVLGRRKDSFPWS
jgi:hypothetical protein